MTMERLRAALADRYTLERELGRGGMATELTAESRGSADVAKATVVEQRCQSPMVMLTLGLRERDFSRAVASATSMR